MRIITLFVTCIICFSSFGEDSRQTSTMDFIQIKNNYEEEALFFYKNNWKKLRVKAIEKGYIDSFLLLETEATDAAPFHIVLITTYLDKNQYNAREENFAELMKGSKGPKLLNKLTPNEFRKALFNKQRATSF